SRTRRRRSPPAIGPARAACPPGMPTGNSQPAPRRRSARLELAGGRFAQVSDDGRIRMGKLRSKQGAAIAAAAIIGAGAGGAAIAASGSGSPFSPSAFLDDLAGRLGVTTEKLKDASKAAAIDQVDAALKAGALTQAQADELKARINAGEGVPFLSGPGFGFHHDGPNGFVDQLDAAATYLGLTEDGLRQKLE